MSEDIPWKYDAKLKAALVRIMADHSGKDLTQQDITRLLLESELLDYQEIEEIKNQAIREALEELIEEILRTDEEDENEIRD